MKRVQCIKPKGEKWSITNDFGPKYGDIVHVVRDHKPTLSGHPTYILKEYEPTLGWAKRCFKDIASDEELNSYRDSLESYNFKEITALEIIYQKQEV